MRGFMDRYSAQSASLDKLKCPLCHATQEFIQSEEGICVKTPPGNNCLVCKRQISTWEKSWHKSLSPDHSRCITSFGKYGMLTDYSYGNTNVMVREKRLPYQARSMTTFFQKMDGHVCIWIVNEMGKKKGLCPIKNISPFSLFKWNFPDQDLIAAIKWGAKEIYIHTDPSRLIKLNLQEFEQSERKTLELLTLICHAVYR